MPLPSNLSDLLVGSDVDLPGDATVGNGHQCEGAKYHSPSPLVVHRVPLVDDPLQSRPEHWVFLCGTCEDNLNVLMSVLRLCEGDVPWPVRREFGNLIRSVAERGWEMMHGE